MILTTAKVEDVERFLSYLQTKGADKRKQYGSGGSACLPRPNDDTRVWVVFDSDEEGYGKLLSGVPDMPAVFQRPDFRGDLGGGAFARGGELGD